MSKASKQRFTDKYLAIQDTYKEVKDVFSKFENKEIQEEHIIDDAINDIKTAQSLLRRLNIKDIYGEYEKSFIENIRLNIEFIKDAFEHFYEGFMGAKLYDEIIDPLRTYIKKTHLLPSEYKKWAKNEKQLVVKFASTLVRHADLFKNQIKRIALGTMSQKEFNKIFNTNKHKMIPLYTFESFSNYKDH
jgi:hypothetical protein